MIVDRSLQIKVTPLISGEAARAEQGAATGRFLNILEGLAEKGFLKNTRQVIVKSDILRSHRIYDAICQMENLEKLDLLGCKLKLEQLKRVFRFCPKLVELYWYPLTYPRDNWAMDEELRNGLRPGFQRLKIFKFKCAIDKKSWPWIQEMLT
jgi:hypothetical protein